MDTIIGVIDKDFMHSESEPIKRQAEEVLETAGKIFKSGGLVAFPTETVYGLGADGLNADASKKIYAAKGRPSDNPLIIHITNMDALEKIVKEVPEVARIVAEKYWPGPLTMIFKFLMERQEDWIRLLFVCRYTRLRERLLMRVADILRLRVPTHPEDRARRRRSMYGRIWKERLT